MFVVVFLVFVLLVVQFVVLSCAIWLFLVLILRFLFFFRWFHFFFIYRKLQCYSKTKIRSTTICYNFNLFNVFLLFFSTSMDFRAIFYVLSLFLISHNIWQIICSCFVHLPCQLTVLRTCILYCVPFWPKKRRFCFESLRHSELLLLLLPEFKTKTNARPTWFITNSSCVPITIQWWWRRNQFQKTTISDWIYIN